MSVKFAAILALSLGSGSCWFQKPTPVFTPPPPQTHPQSTAPADVSTLPSPPKIEGDPSATAPPETPATMPPPADPPKPKVTGPTRRTTPAATPPPKEVTPPAPDPPPPPKLSQMFTPEELNAYNRRLDESLDRVSKAQAVLARKRLNAEEREIADRINTFKRQAEQARKQDLVTAVSLASRADVLATDLLQRLPR